MGSVLAANTLTHLDSTNGDTKLTFNIINRDAAAKAIEEYECYGIFITVHKLKGMEIVLPGGLTMGATADEIIAVYGEPTEENISDSGILRAFTYGDSNRIQLTFTDDGLMDSVRYTVKS